MLKRVRRPAERIGATAASVVSDRYAAVGGHVRDETALDELLEAYLGPGWFTRQSQQ